MSLVVFYCARQPNTCTSDSYGVSIVVTGVPEELRLYALQCAIQLLPDVNREAAYLLISFLKAVSEHEKDNSVRIEFTRGILPFV